MAGVLEDHNYAHTDFGIKIERTWTVEWIGGQEVSSGTVGLIDLPSTKRKPPVGLSERVERGQIAYATFEALHQHLHERILMTDPRWDRCRNTALPVSWRFVVNRVDGSRFRLNIVLLLR